MRRVRLTLLALVTAAWTATAAVAAPPPVRDPPARWLLTGPIHDPRTGQAVAELADGRVLVCGGQIPYGSRPIDSCEAWNPETERWTPAGKLPFPRTRLAAVRLADDRVALVGGYGTPADGSPRGASDVIDVWEPRRNDVVSGGLLPFRALNPVAVRLPDGRLFVIDDGPDAKKLRAAVWNPSDGKSSDEATPGDDGQTAALLVDAHGTLTLVRSARDCRQTSIWRRRASEGWVRAHVEPTRGCAVGAIALDDHQIIYWSSHTSPAAMLWNASTGVSRSVDVPAPERLEHLLALGADRLLAVGSGTSYLYEPGRGWRATGPSPGDFWSMFTLVRGGRVLGLAQLEARVWTPSVYLTERPCAYLTAQLRGGAEVSSSYHPQPTPDNVDPACWAAIAADPTLEVSRALKDAAQGPEREGRRQAIQMLCDVRAVWAVDVMTRGLSSYGGIPSCVAALAESDQPDARQAVDGYVQDLMRSDHGYNVLVEASRSSERARARAAEVLVVAWHDHRLGFDALKAQVCRPPVPGVAAEICRKAEPNQDSKWRQEPERRHAWLMTGAVAAIGAGLAIGGYATRNNDAGEAFAIAAGALGIGAIFTVPMMETVDHSGPPIGFEDGFVGCAAISGGLVGLVGAALVTGSSGSSSGGPRAAISIAGGALFTLTALIPIWHF